MTYLPITMTQKDSFYDLWHTTPQRSIDYTFVNLWGWTPYFGLQWQFTDKLCWVRQTLPNTINWAPIGDWHNVDWVTDPTLAKGGTFIRVPEVLAHIWSESLGERVQLEEARGHWEYLYAQEDLVNLAGKQLRKKKTHVNGYIKTYGEPDYRTLEHESCLEDMLKLQDEWCQWNECAQSKSLRAENESINRILTHLNDIPHLVGGALYIEEQIVAFSVGEKLDDTTLGVHYEKGHTKIRGVYQTINNCFAQHAGAGFRFLNRAQDLDEEGLRQAKMTYAPVDFLRKYVVHIAPVS